jgi:hypothetical protein
LPSVNSQTSRNTAATARDTATTAGNTGILVEQGEITLTPSPVYPSHGILQLINLVNEVLTTGAAVHYQLGDLGEVFGGTYAGFELDPQAWWDLLSPSTSDTLQGTLNTVHEQLQPTEWIHDKW